MKMTTYLVLACCATGVAAPFAADALIEKRDNTVITIEVPVEDLARCRETLRQVAQMPAVTDDGTPIASTFSEELPSVACVAKDA